MTISQRLMRGVALTLAAVVAGVFAPTVAHAAGGTVTRNATMHAFVYSFTVTTGGLPLQIEFDVPAGINVLPWTDITWSRSGNHWTGTSRRGGGYFGTGGSDNAANHQLLNCVINGAPCTIIIG